MPNKTKVKISEKFINHPLFNEKVCGMNFGFLSKRGYYEREETLKQPKIMSEYGVNWVTLNLNICQEKYFSDNIFLDFEYSVSELELYEITKELKACGIKILFKPCLTPLDGQWMGAVNFPETGKQIQGLNIDYWGKWFASFKKAVVYFSKLSEKLQFDALLIGAEYFGTESRDEEWRTVIAEARKYYGGPVSYEFTPDSHKTYELKWFNELDFLSYSFYPPACGGANIKNPAINPEFTAKQMSEYLQKCKEEITGLSQRFGNKPILFTEYGIRSAHGCIMQPYNFLWKTYYDGEEQANYMEASFKTFWELPEWLGLLWWKWDETQDRPHYKTDPKGDMGFTVQGKPAQAVLKKWFAETKKSTDK